MYMRPPLKYHMQILVSDLSYDKIQEKYSHFNLYNKNYLISNKKFSHSNHANITSHRVR